MTVRALVLMVMIIALLVERNFSHDTPDVVIEYFHRDGDNKDGTKIWETIKIILSRNSNTFSG